MSNDSWGFDDPDTIAIFGEKPRDTVHLETAREELADPLRIIKIELVALVISSRDPITAHEVAVRYLDEYDSQLKPSKYGYDTVDELLAAMPDKLYRTHSQTGDIVYIAKQDYRTADLQRLVSRQLTTAQSRARSSKYRASQRGRGSRGRGRASAYGAAFRLTETAEIKSRMPGFTSIHDSMSIRSKSGALPVSLNDDGPRCESRCRRIIDMVRESGHRDDSDGTCRLPLAMLKDVYQKKLALPLWGRTMLTEEYAASMGDEVYHRFWRIENVPIDAAIRNGGPSMMFWIVVSSVDKEEKEESSDQTVPESAEIYSAISPDGDCKNTSGDARWQENRFQMTNDEDKLASVPVSAGIVQPQRSPKKISSVGLRLLSAFLPTRRTTSQENLPRRLCDQLPETRNDLLRRRIESPTPLQQQSFNQSPPHHQTFNQSSPPQLQTISQSSLEKQSFDQTSQDARDRRTPTSQEEEPRRDIDSRNTHIKSNDGYDNDTTYDREQIMSLREVRTLSPELISVLRSGFRELHPSGPTPYATKRKFRSFAETNTMRRATPSFDDSDLNSVLQPIPPGQSAILKKTTSSLWSENKQVNGGLCANLGPQPTHRNSSYGNSTIPPAYPMPIPQQLPPPWLVYRPPPMVPMLPVGHFVSMVLPPPPPIMAFPPPPPYSMFPHNPRSAMHPPRERKPLHIVDPGIQPEWRAMSSSIAGMKPEPVINALKNRIPSQLTNSRPHEGSSTTSFASSNHGAGAPTIGNKSPFGAPAAPSSTSVFGRAHVPAQSASSGFPAPARESAAPSQEFAAAPAQAMSSRFSAPSKPAALNRAPAPAAAPSKPAALNRAPAPAAAPAFAAPTPVRAASSGSSDGWGKEENDNIHHDDYRREVAPSRSEQVPAPEMNVRVDDYCRENPNSRSFGVSRNDANKPETAPTPTTRKPIEEQADLDFARDVMTNKDKEEDLDFAKGIMMAKREEDHSELEDSEERAVFQHLQQLFPKAGFALAKEQIPPPLMKIVDVNPSHFVVQALKPGVEMVTLRHPLIPSSNLCMNGSSVASVRSVVESDLAWMHNAPCLVNIDQADYHSAAPLYFVPPRSVLMNMENGNPEVERFEAIQDLLGEYYSRHEFSPVVDIRVGSMYILRTEKDEYARAVLLDSGSDQGLLRCALLDYMAMADVTSSDLSAVPDKFSVDNLHPNLFFARIRGIHYVPLDKQPTVSMDIGDLTPNGITTVAASQAVAVFGKDDVGVRVVDWVISRYDVWKSQHLCCDTNGEHMAIPLDTDQDPPSALEALEFHREMVNSGTLLQHEWYEENRHMENQRNNEDVKRSLDAKYDQTENATIISDNGTVEPIDLDDVYEDVPNPSNPEAVAPIATSQVSSQKQSVVGCPSHAVGKESNHEREDEQTVRHQENFSDAYELVSLCSRLSSNVDYNQKTTIIHQGLAFAHSLKAINGSGDPSALTISEWDQAIEKLTSLLL